MALIEADTDGVFFAVPAGWTEEQERACVAAVAATLPAGIRLEYEGRYQAMLSHEVKNYALLTYDGRADRARRGAPLQPHRAVRRAVPARGAALPARGDIAGVRRVYLDTIAALRGRPLRARRCRDGGPADQDARGVRRSRARKAREAAYEALLAAGRTRWRAGERVRFYRAADGAAVWLPDGDGAMPAGERPPSRATAGPRPATRCPPYDIAHYLAVLQHLLSSRASAKPSRRTISSNSSARRPGRLDLAEIRPRWNPVAASYPRYGGSKRRLQDKVMMAAAAAEGGCGDRGIF